MKTISVKRLQAYIVFLNLKRTAPKEFPDLDEMTVTVDVILPAFEKHAGRFAEFNKQSDVLGNERGIGKLSDEEWKEKVAVLQKQVREYELTSGEEIVQVELETTAYQKFIAQFDRWGKAWFTDLQEFVNFNKALRSTDVKKE